MRINLRCSFSAVEASRAFRFRRLFPLFQIMKGGIPYTGTFGSFFGLKVRTDVSPSSLDYKVIFWTRDQLN